MPAKYVEITRVEFEDWLDSLGKKWTRDQRTAGVYYVHLSDKVGVRISSSLRQTDAVVQRASASIEVVLASIITHKTLNRRGGEQSRYHRTQGWRDSLKRGVQHFARLYEAARAYYDRLAPIENRDAYKADRLRILDQVPGVSDDDVLSHIHKRLVEGGVLDEAQEAVLRVAAALTPNQLQFLKRLEELRRKATRDPKVSAMVPAVRRVVWTGKSLEGSLRQQLALALQLYGV